MPFVIVHKKRTQFGDADFQVFMMLFVCSHPNAVQFRFVGALAQDQHNPFAQVDIVHAEHLFKKDAVRQIIQHKIKWEGGHWVIGSLVIGH